MKAMVTKIAALLAIVASAIIPLSAARIANGPQTGDSEPLDSSQKTLASKLAPHTAMLSSGGRDLVALSQRWRQIELARAARGQPGRASLQARASVFAARAVSNPAQDLKLSRIGTAQSETSTAWCGSNVVVGFNDGDSFAETVGGSGGVSLAGFSVSNNGGTLLAARGLVRGPRLASSGVGLHQYAAWRSGGSLRERRNFSVCLAFPRGRTQARARVAARRRGRTVSRV